MALKVIEYGTSEYHQMVNLRDEILRHPLGLKITEEDIRCDRDNVLIGAFDDDEMLGCCMLEKGTGNEILLRQMAVKNDLQGKGIGRALMNFAENIARDLGYGEMTMYARTTVAGFYERLGYRIVGKEFIKLTIPHVVMRKSLQPLTAKF